MNAVANIFDLNNDGYIDYYEFVSALHPSRDPYRRPLDADQINEEVSQVTFSFLSMNNHPCVVLYTVVQEPLYPATVSVADTPLLVL